MNQEQVLGQRILNTTVIVSALGYFVDIYDLLLFGIVRVPSLRALGVPEADLLSIGMRLLNMQMAGMLVGGILWGVLGDKKGRVSVLFGSIFLYSVANILNAFVHSVGAYEVLRFLAGLGLAGELGAAITLVSEVMSKETRGYGTTIVASVGITGAVVAGLVGDLFSWKTAYIIGGLLGVLLLIARMSIFESGMFKNLTNKSVRRGEFWMLFTSGARFKRYLSCILIGLPIWSVIGILITFSPEISRELGVTGPVSAAKAIMYNYAGLTIGDLAAGFLSQYFRSRKRVVFSFMTLSAALVLVYVFGRGWSPAEFYLLCSAIGVGTGYWAVFVTMASEQFGTNIRATVTTTVPNFVRGSVVLVTFAFQAAKSHFPVTQSCLLVVGSSLVIGFLGLLGLHETHGKDLDYIEMI